MSLKYLRAIILEKSGERRNKIRGILKHEILINFFFVFLRHGKSLSEIAETV